MSYYGYSPETYDPRWEERSVMNKVQQKYWKTKQTLIRVTGKKEDEFVVASDSDLDRKLEVFQDVQRSCVELLKVIELYQRRLGALSEEENDMGHFLKHQGSQEQTRAGKMMLATGKALCFSSQQRLVLHHPLMRLHQEVETFRYRAISDTLITINRMEQQRTEYRGALLWMKDVSQELDPDTYKQLEKFRKVQTQVRVSKGRFDKLKNDVCQKVDLLGASRCNLLSHTLATYQTSLLHFWEKTSRTMAAIYESYKDYQPMYKATDKPGVPGHGKKSAKETVGAGEKVDGEEQRDATGDDDELICLGEDGSMGKAAADGADGTGSGGALDLTDLGHALAGTPADGERDVMSLLNDILNAGAPGEEGESGGFSRQWYDVFGDDGGPAGETWPQQSRQQQRQGATALTATAPGGPGSNPDGPPAPGPTVGGFLPSQLLDMSSRNEGSARPGWSLPSNRKQFSATSQADAHTGLGHATAKPIVDGAGKPGKDMSAWFNLFADLDPLQNPDAIGRTSEDQELMNA
uniref:Islet cell autoantigen 1-like isoform X2 n=1 Tax=Petromyzon marinus TaxID=7757 RepID=A0AAJ7WWY7_PETMA|nr:islet cell autoantigen 1-like isoform X2 [Petromyzon marinus]